MQEPAYISKNGQSIPYIPVEVKTARDAYAASLHILFKHVADFHICVVRAFSVKYGIPEDDILKTIQESDEFQNMKVDPVLDMGVDSLGYLEKEEAPVPKEEAPVPKEEAPVPKEEAPVPKEEVPVPKEEVPVKRTKSTKMTKTNAVVIIAEKSREFTEARPDPVPESDPSTIKIKTIRKKMVVPKLATATTAATASPATTAAPITPATTAAPITPATTAATASLATTAATTPATTPAPITPATTAAPTTPATTAAMQTLATRPEENAPRKIIKKKTTIVAAGH
jgi:hypothetical protein